MCKSACLLSSIGGASSGSYYSNRECVGPVETALYIEDWWRIVYRFKGCRVSPVLYVYDFYAELVCQGDFLLRIEVVSACKNSLGGFYTNAFYRSKFGDGRLEDAFDCVESFEQAFKCNGPDTICTDEF